MQGTQRDAFVDQFRGLLVAHMALDHCSMLLNPNHWGKEFAYKQPPLPESMAQFLTRFSGVPVAAGFLFMAGYMVALTSQRREARGVARGDVTRRLLIRGLVLLVVDATLMGLPRLALGFVSMAILSCLGAGLVLLAVVRHVHRGALLAIALVILGLHPLLGPGGALDITGLPEPLPALLYWPDREGMLRSLYPLLPWFGVMLLGFLIGAESIKREDPRGLWLTLGLLACIAFFAVRLNSGYGNAYPHGGLGALDFWVFSKYPPDLAWLSWSFFLIFLGLVIIRSLPAKLSSLLRPFTAFGRVSFFFYVVHFYVLGIWGSALNVRLSLGWTYLAWAVLLAAMHWPCRWYFEKKHSRPNWITRYV